MQKSTNSGAWWREDSLERLPMVTGILQKVMVLSLVSAVAVAPGIGLAAAQTAAKQPLGANDVSILFPVPRAASDLDNLIAVSDLTGPAAAPQRGRLWSETDFASFLRIAEDPAVQVADAGLPIVLPAEVKQVDAWFIAGIRIDAGAPGLSKEIIGQYGQQPQIRFIAQPITRLAGGQIKIHDIAAHLIFSFTSSRVAQPPCLPLIKPDMAAFQVVVNDVVALRDQLAAGTFGGINIVTAGRPLGVHPGLMGASAKPFRDALKGMLEKNLAPQRLFSMAIMALNAPEPWIFVAMQKIELPDHQFVFVKVPGPMLDGKQVAQMLSFRGAKHVMPAPATNNQNPITCRHAAFQDPPLPLADRKGVATADFIDGQLAESRTREIVDVISDPSKSHFFNTDCVSCHTDTRQAMDRIKDFTVPGVDPEALPKENWNVRNFGWFPSFFRRGTVDATVTRRTAMETAEVVTFINRELLNK